MVNNFKNRLLKYRISVSIICTLSMVYILFINPVDGFSINNLLKQLGHFSIISFLIVTATFIILTISQLSKSKKIYPKAEHRGAALLYSTVTCFIFVLFFHKKMDTQGFQTYVFYFAHIAFPLFLLIDNTISLPSKIYKYDLLIYWLIYPFYYLIFLIVESYIFHYTRYQFLAINDQYQSFYPIAILLLTSVFIVSSVIIIFINHYKDLVFKIERD